MEFDKGCPADHPILNQEEVVKFIVDSPANFCPNCGKKIPWEIATIESFYFGVPCNCSCGAQYQYVPGFEILDLAGRYKYGGQDQSGVLI